MRFEPQVSVWAPVLALGVALTCLVGCTSRDAPDAAPSSSAAAPSSSDVALECPESLPSTRPAANATPSRIPVPKAPTSGLVCRYAGSVDKVPSGSLTDQVAVLDPAALALAINQGDVVAAAIYDCVIDFGARDLVLFGYATGATARVVVSLNGCRTVTSLTFDTPARWLSGAAATTLRLLTGPEPRPH